MFALMFFVLLTGEWVGHELLGGRARWRHSSTHLALVGGLSCGRRRVDCVGRGGPGPVPVGSALLTRIR